MLPIVPPVLPEEVLAHYWLRVLALNGVRSAREIAGALFGAPWRASDVWVPRGIRDVSRVLDVPGEVRSPEYWISAHTAYPYFASTLTNAHAALLVSRMLERGQGPVRPAKLLTLTEYRPMAPYACPICVSESLENYGVPAIRRLWTLPYVMWCPAHQLPLRPVDDCADSSASLHVPASRRQERANAIAFAEWSASLLGSAFESPGAAAPRVLRLAVRQRLGAMSAQSVVQEVAARWAHGTGHPALNSIVRDENDLRSLVESFLFREKRLHPTLAVLICATFFEAPCALFKGGASDSVATQDVRISRRVDEDRAIAIVRASASMRQAALALGLSVTTVAELSRRNQIDVGARPSRLKPELVLTVERALASGASPFDVARHQGVSVVSVYRILKRNTVLRETISRVKFQRERDRRRNQWLVLRRNYPEASQTQLRMLAKADYAWLYRNDVDFLLKHAPPTAVRVHAVSAPLWRRAESFVMNQLLNASSAIARQSVERPEFPSLERIAKKAGLPRYLADRIRDNKAVYDRIRTAADGKAAFVKRRIEWAKDKVEGDGFPAATWRIRRVAGLRAETLRAVEPRLSETKKKR